MTDAAWFVFKAYNSQTIYGYGTAEEADKCEDILSRGREVNHYHARPMTEEEVTELDYFNTRKGVAMSEIIWQDRQKELNGDYDYPVRPLEELSD